MAETTTYVTLKRAAKRLGVHEQTLRSWEKRGLIRMVHLPGSGYRRVPVTEIERLQTAMRATPLARGVRIVSPRQDPDALAQAKALAEAVQAELVDLGASSNLDEFMAEGRGRSWSP